MVTHFSPSLSLKQTVHQIAQRRADPQTPVWRAEITRIHVLLIVEGALALVAVGFGINDWVAGYPLTGLAEICIGIFFLATTPYLRLRYPVEAVDVLELSVVAALLLIVTYGVLPSDATVLFTITLFPPIAALLRRRKGWRWVLGFLPLHLGVSWWSLTQGSVDVPLLLHTPAVPPIFMFMRSSATGYLLLTDYLVYLLVALVVYATTTMMEGYESAWHEAAAKDPLTGAYNRLAFRGLYHKYYAQMQPTGAPLAGILLDIDNFKQINDRFGHNAGDAVLKEVSRLLRESTRRTDSVIRWGGEEFLVLLPDTHLEEALRLAERLRETLAAHSFSIERPVTASFGVTELRPGDSQEEFVHRCDQALYFAKEQGKNRVAFWQREVLRPEERLRLLRRSA